MPYDLGPEPRLRLARAIARAKRRALSAPWRNDRDACIIWVADIYRIALGFDPVAEYRGKEEEMLKRLDDESFEGLVTREIERLLGWPQIEPATALVGDFALVQTNVCGAAIFDGHVFLTRVDGGYAGHPADNVKAAWRVVA